MVLGTDGLSHKAQWVGEAQEVVYRGDTQVPSLSTTFFSLTLESQVTKA